ncbi:MarR family transcriptional regulator [Acetobacteraceae bacterium H6797]|nr:MarR family transcriptional regulator [Acetobacteraceae bacterium H6797]
MSPSPIAARQTFLTDLSVAGRKLRTLFDGKMKERGLTLSRARALLHLSTCEAVSQTELASVLDIEQPTLVRLLDGLEKQGLIERKAVDGDRRAKQICLTDKSQQQVAEIQEIVDQMRETLLTDMTEEELTVAGRVLNLLIRRIETTAEPTR